MTLKNCKQAPANCPGHSSSLIHGNDRVITCQKGLIALGLVDDSNGEGADARDAHLTQSVRDGVLTLQLASACMHISGLLSAFQSLL